ncbi:MAG TPA: acyltransferase [Baekduia sp.]|uniref:acyltransferase family protein n=1 Tax=Baekduia sp. TaxID=2600305 RepID=UPI002D77FCCA|nr:acyltransferase [Baekduia sp.]HET6508379.1 acyltransferase [Baekduia sp.]
MSTRAQAPVAPVEGRKLGHVPGLDGIRAIAALAVVGFHLRLAVFGNGDIGVDIFFVLSGFLITSILLTRTPPGGRVDFRDFYRRRALRLLPAYFAVVFACVVAECFSDYGATFKGAVFGSFYVANWVQAIQGTGLGTLSHAWSLSIEEQFYLVWPALLGLLLHRFGWNGRALLKAVAALLASAWLLVAALALVDAPARVASNATPTRAVELLFGALLAIYVATPSLSGDLAPRRGRSAVALAGVAALVALLGLIVLTGTTPDEDSLIGWPVISVLTCTVIYACLRHVPAVTAPLGVRPMVEIGRRSYGLYLWHFPIFVIVDTRWGLDSTSARLGALAVTVVVVMLSYRFVEQPFLRRKDAAAPETIEPADAAPALSSPAVAPTSA